MDTRSIIMLIYFSCLIDNLEIFLLSKVIN